MVGDIRIHEFIYPLLQGWDSVVIEADVEMGGSDQLFNNLVGREFQKEEGQDPQVVMVTPLLVGTDGTMKMSKSKGNYIGVTDPPSGPTGMFGKIMSLPDTLLENYYTLLTDDPPEEFTVKIKSDPRGAKVALAKRIIGWLHDSASGDAAEREFVRATHGGIPDEMPEVPIDRECTVPAADGQGGADFQHERGDSEDQGGGGEDRRAEGGASEGIFV